MSDPIIDVIKYPSYYIPTLEKLGNIVDLNMNDFDDTITFIYTCYKKTFTNTKDVFISMTRNEDETATDYIERIQKNKDDLNIFGWCLSIMNYDFTVSLKMKRKYSGDSI